MRTLIISQEPWYADMARELRKNNDVDYLHRGASFRAGAGDIQIPKLFGFEKGYLLLAYLVTSFLLCTRRYDVCITDYKSIYFTTIFPLLRKYGGAYRTTFIYDMRTVPVGYPQWMHDKIQKVLRNRLRFANSFYQAVTLITEEMQRYLEQHFFTFRVPVAIWESGVDAALFRPLPKDPTLKRNLGFGDDDFVCFYHGSLGYRRGVVELVEAFKIIRGQNGAIKLIVLGEGESRARIEGFVSQFGLQETVKLHALVPKEEVPGYLSLADLCVIPLADIEWWRMSSPLKLMEYIASGKNILLTDIVAHTNVVGLGSPNFWLRDVTPEHIARGILEAFAAFREDPVHFREGGLKQRDALLAKLTWRERAERLQRFMEALHPGGGASTPWGPKEPQ